MISRATKLKHKREVYTLKEEVAEAKRQKLQAEKKADDILTEITEIKLLIDTLYRAATGHVTGGTKDFEYGYSRRSDALIETTAKGKLQQILVELIQQKVEFGREDEGTELMQEHVDNLLRIIRVLSHDQTLDKEMSAKIKEAEKVTDLNIDNMKNGRGHGIIPPINLI